MPRPSYPHAVSCSRARIAARQFQFVLIDLLRFFPCLLGYPNFFLIPGPASPIASTRRVCVSECWKVGGTQRVPGACCCVHCGVWRGGRCVSGAPHCTSGPGLLARWAQPHADAVLNARLPTDGPPVSMFACLQAFASQTARRRACQGRVCGKHPRCSTRRRRRRGAAVQGRRRICAGNARRGLGAASDGSHGYGGRMPCTLHICIASHAPHPGHAKHVPRPPLHHIVQQSSTPYARLGDLYWLPASHFSYSLLRSHYGFPQGLPVIATNYSGLTEFLTSSTAFPLPVRELEPGADGGDWAAIDTSALRRLLRSVYNNRNHAAAVGRRAREHVVAR